MKIILILLAILLSSQMIQAQEWQYNDSTSIILIKFSEKMSITGLRDTENYKMIDDNNKQILIYKIGLVTKFDNTTVTDTSAIALITKKINDNKVHKISISNLKDINDNPLKQEDMPVTLNNKNYIIDVIQPELKK